MILIQMQVRRHNVPRASMHTYFTIPKGPSDLKAAWLRNCEHDMFNQIVENWEQPILNPLGTHICCHEGKRIGSITLRQLSVHDASLPPSYAVEFQLECGFHWIGEFECEIKELTNKVREDFENRVGANALKQAARIFDLHNPQSDLETAHCLLEYAGVPIGTVTVRKVL